MGVQVLMRYALLLVVILLSAGCDGRRDQRASGSPSHGASQSEGLTGPWIDTGPPPIRNEPMDRNDFERDRSYQRRSFENYERGMGR